DTVHVVVTTLGGTSPTSPADRFTYTTVATGACGDGTLDPGEECDDGPATGLPGDCCDALCRFQPAGVACADDGDPCTVDACGGAGAGAPVIAPAPVCIPPSVSRGASLLLRTTTGGGRQAAFTWAKGPAVAVADFGDPRGGGTGLCVYEQGG